jgi:hypothetical protein
MTRLFCGMRQIELFVQRYNGRCANCVSYICCVWFSDFQTDSNVGSIMNMGKRVPVSYEGYNGCGIRYVSSIVMFLRSNYLSQASIS